MRRTHGRAALLLFGGVAAVLLTGLVAWACVPAATLIATPNQGVKPGDTISVSGRSYGSANPVMVRWNAIDGPVLAEAKADGGFITNVPVTIPENAQPGNYVLVATQEAAAGSTTWGIPARALVVVGEGAPVAPAAQVEERPAGLVTGGSVSTGDLILVGLGAAGLAMFIAGIAALTASRRRPVAEPVRTER